MVTRLNRAAYEQLCREDERWLDDAAARSGMSQSLEYDHVKHILRESPLIYYTFETAIDVLRIVGEEPEREFTVADFCAKLRPMRSSDEVKRACAYLAAESALREWNDGTRGMVYQAQSREDDDEAQESGERESVDDSTSDLRALILETLRALAQTSHLSRRWFYYSEIQTGVWSRDNRQTDFAIRECLNTMIAEGDVVADTSGAAFQLTPPESVALRAEVLATLERLAVVGRQTPDKWHYVWMIERDLPNPHAEAGRDAIVAALLYLVARKQVECSSSTPNASAMYRATKRPSSVMLGATTQITINPPSARFEIGDEAGAFGQVKDSGYVLPEPPPSEFSAPPYVAEALTQGAMIVSTPAQACGATCDEVTQGEACVCVAHAGHAGKHECACGRSW